MQHNDINGKPIDNIMASHNLNLKRLESLKTIAESCTSPWGKVLWQQKKNAYQIQLKGL